MKKILSLAVIAAVTLFASCNNGSPKASMKNDVDTLSYEIGLSQTAGIENYFQQSGIDSAYIDDFLRGVKDGASIARHRKKWMVDSILPSPYPFDHSIFCGAFCPNLFRVLFLRDEQNSPRGYSMDNRCGHSSLSIPFALLWYFPLSVALHR